MKTKKVSHSEFETGTKLGSGNSYNLIVRPTIPVKITLSHNGIPRANETYKLVADDKTVEGKTNNDGQLEAKIPVDTESGQLFIGDPPLEDCYEIEFADYDKMSDISKCSRLLANLGFYDGDFAEPLEEKIKSAISEFQAVKNLEVTGKLDSNTKQELFKT